jgi:hypothetical protein
MIAGGDIRADGSIRAGEGVKADGVIQAGDGHGVYAGLSVRLDAWSVCARVVARSRPAQLVSGHWAGPSTVADGDVDADGEVDADGNVDADSSDIAGSTANAGSARQARPVPVSPALA